MQSHLLGVTIGGGSVFAEMARLAAARFTVATGARAEILTSAHWSAAGYTKPHLLKFDLFRLFPEASEILFFDADVLFLRPFSLDDIRSPLGFSAVRDISDAPWIIRDAERAGVEPREYFNSGLFWIHRDRASLLDLAGELRSSRAISTPFNDQTFLNAAAARTGGVHWLPKRLNYHVDPIATTDLSAIVGAHMHFIANDSDPARLARYYIEPESFFWQL